VDLEVDTTKVGDSAFTVLETLGIRPVAKNDTGQRVPESAARTPSKRAIVRSVYV
jgi:hypothetical protein